MGYAARHRHGAAARARHAAMLELQEQQRMRELAAQIPDEPMLIKILDDCQPHLREHVKAALWPYLQFTPVTEPAPPAPVQEPLEEPTAVESEGTAPAFEPDDDAVDDGGLTLGEGLLSRARLIDETGLPCTEEQWERLRRQDEDAADAEAREEYP